MIKRKLGRSLKHRVNMLKNLAESLLLYEKITTTQAKAKEVRSIVEKSITIAKSSDLTARRRLLSQFLHNKNVVEKLIVDIAPRFKNTKSGFIKIFKVNPRVGDNAQMATIILSKSKFLNNLEEPKKEVSSNKTKTTKKKA